MMINIKYNIDFEELAEATVDFVKNRPVMRLMHSIMSITATLLIISFIFRTYMRYPTKISDLLSSVFAISWIMFYKNIHKSIILRTLKKRSSPNLELNIQITNQQIHLFNNLDNNSFKLPWKKIRFIAKNNTGYIIPLTGLANAGKFIWLPFYKLKESSQEESFLKLIEKFNIKIKNY